MSDLDTLRDILGKMHIGQRHHADLSWLATNGLHVLDAARADTSDPEGLRADDADKLRVLATWFDDFDDWREKTGKIAPGIAEYREVQTDLRRIAAALRVTPPGLDVERLRYTAYVDGRACHNCGLEPYQHECPAALSDTTGTPEP